MVSQMRIKYVKTLILGNNISHVDFCKLNTLAVQELAKGHWQSLVKLIISNNIIMKGGVKDSEMRDADNSQRCKLRI